MKLTILVVALVGCVAAFDSANAVDPAQGVEKERQGRIHSGDQTTDAKSQSFSDSRERSKERIRQLHLSAFDRSLRKSDEEKALQEYNEILHIDPTNALAMNNKACLVATMTGGDKEFDNNLRDQLPLLSTALKHANYQEVAEELWVSLLDNGSELYVAQLPRDSRAQSLRGVVIRNLENIYKRLKIKSEVPPNLEPLTIRRAVSNSGKGIPNTRLWLVELLNGGRRPEGGWKLGITASYSQTGELISPTTVSNDKGEFVFSLEYDQVHQLITNSSLGLVTTKSGRYGDSNKKILFRDKQPYIFSFDGSQILVELGSFELQGFPR